MVEEAVLAQRGENSEGAGQAYPARVFEKRLAIWPASPHVGVALGFIIPPSAVTRGHEGHCLSEHRNSTGEAGRACPGCSRVQVTPNCV
jgi:hypothetical protein